MNVEENINSTISINIPSYSDKTINKKSVTFYLIDIVNHYSNKKWKLEKRFSQFKEFSQIIQKLFPKCPIFPESSIINFFLGSNLETKKNDLQNYLNDCIKRPDIMNSEAIKAFLEVFSNFHYFYRLKRILMKLPLILLRKSLTC